MDGYNRIIEAQHIKESIMKTTTNTLSEEFFKEIELEQYRSMAREMKIERLDEIANEYELEAFTLAEMNLATLL